MGSEQRGSARVKAASNSSNGVFCLEGEWDRDLRGRLSVEPILELLERLGAITYIHRDVATVGELQYYVDRWQERPYNKYRVLYLAMHGDTGSVHLGRDNLDLGSLGEVLEGKCSESIIYFGSCMTMLGDEQALTDFVKRTGALAAVGYTQAIDWLRSSSFDVVLLEQLTRHLKDRRRMDFIFRRLTEQHGDYARDLGLTIAAKTRGYYAE